MSQIDDVVAHVANSKEHVTPPSKSKNRSKTVPNLAAVCRLLWTCDCETTWHVVLFLDSHPRLPVPVPGPAQSPLVIAFPRSHCPPS